jgi:predicted outer membrane repeat protein
MVTVVDNRYRINGLLAAETPVLQNLEKLCNAAGTWLTYDIQDGLWSLIINKSGNSVHSFDDSNIIGGISINGTGLYNLYNKVIVSYPHVDLNDQKDNIIIEIPAGDRNANEPDNTLNINYDIVTNPVQAQLLGFIELKQSRVDQIIVFRTDFSKIDVKAGDIIDITNSIYGFNQKKYRVVTVREVDSNEGAIDIEITALEYDDAVYDESNLSRYTVSTSTGIASIGAIAPPDQPTVVKFEQDARPRVEISTIVNNGLVDGVEFWITYNVGEAFPDDALRTYTLLTTARPGNGTVFGVNETVQVDVDFLNASSFLVKCRCTNGSATSAFSGASGLQVFQPVQTTQAITDDTGLYDNTGLLTAISALALLQSLLSYFDPDTGYTFPGSGGPGGGSTFLLLTFENIYQSSAGLKLLPQGGTVEGPSGPTAYYYPPDYFIPLVGIVSPAESATMVGIDQNFLPQYVTTDLTNNPNLGTQNLYKYIWPDPVLTEETGPGFPDRTLIRYISENQFGVDLVAYKHYYPDATEFKIDLRGYWQKIIQQQNTGNVLVDQYYATGIGSGTGIRVRAHIYTDTFPQQGGNISPILTGVAGTGNWFVGNTLVSKYYVPTGGANEPEYTISNEVVGYSNVANVGNVATYRFGSNGTGFSTAIAVSTAVDFASNGGGVGPSRGLSLGTFNYDLSAQYAQDAPSFSLVPRILSNTVQVPYTWEFRYEGGDIVGVQPATSVNTPADFFYANMANVNLNSSTPFTTQSISTLVQVPMSAVVYEYPLDSDYIVVRTISYATVRGNLTQAGPEGIDVKRVGVTFASNIGYDDYGGAIYAKNANVTPVLAGNVYLKTTVV